jgi:hypothetical protein
MARQSVASADRILLALDREAQGQGGDLTPVLSDVKIPCEGFWIDRHRALLECR